MRGEDIGILMVVATMADFVNPVTVVVPVEMSDPVTEPRPDEGTVTGADSVGKIVNTGVGGVSRI